MKLSRIYEEVLYDMQYAVEICSNESLQQTEELLVPARLLFYSIDWNRLVGHGCRSSLCGHRNRQSRFPFGIDN